jgi:hypothetical protein
MLNASRMPRPLNASRMPRPLNASRMPRPTLSRTSLGCAAGKLCVGEDADGRTVGACDQAARALARGSQR